MSSEAPAEIGPLVGEDVIAKPRVAWLSCYDGSSGDLKVNLRSNAPGSNEPVMLAQRFNDITTIDRECIVAVKWLKAFSIGVMGPSSGTTNFQRAYLLEELPPNAPEVEVYHRLAAWKTLASLSGLKVRTNWGEDETDAVIERADLNRKLLAEALDLRNAWPLGFLSVDGRAKSLLLEHAAMEDENHISIAPETQEELQDTADIDAPVVQFSEEPSQPVEEQLSAAEHPSNTSMANLGMGDFLDGELNEQIIAGMYPPKFVTQGHNLRQGTPWSVVLCFPQKRRGRPGYDALICSLADPHRYANDSACVLRPGKPGESTETSIPEVRLWKAAAACFGINAVSKTTLPVEPFNHERTQRLIKKYGTKVLAAIDAWPVIGHANLKAVARARALAVLGINEPDITGDPPTSLIEEQLNWSHLVRTPSPLGAEGAPDLSARADAGSVNPESETPDVADDDTQTAVACSIEQQSTQASPPAPEQLMNVAFTAHRQARAALAGRVAEVHSALQKKEEAIRSLQAEVESDRKSIAAQEAQLTRIDDLISSLESAFRIA